MRVYVYVCVCVCVNIGMDFEDEDYDALLRDVGSVHSDDLDADLQAETEPHASAHVPVEVSLKHHRVMAQLKTEAAVKEGKPLDETQPIQFDDQLSFDDGFSFCGSSALSVLARP
jgi:hypothetical protein